MWRPGGTEIRSSWLLRSVRFPGYTISPESMFGLRDQRLSLRHEPGTTAQPYIGGALLGIRKVSVVG